MYAYHHTGHTAIKTPGLQQRIPSSHPNQKQTVTFQLEPSTVYTQKQDSEKQAKHVRNATSPNTTRNTTTLDNLPSASPRSSIGHNITVHLHHAHVAHSATSTHRTGRPHQPESHVQPTHTPMTTDNKTTRYSKTTTTANRDTAQL
jgi:hypothetical protein